MRILLNLYPPYLFSRTRVKHISPDWREIIVELAKSIMTRNYVGTTFGGSLYQAVDPMFMLMLIKIMGLKDYLIWDKSAKIEYKKPARSKVTYHCKVTDKDLAYIHNELKTSDVCHAEFQTEGIDQEGNICVIIRKTIYIKKKSST